MPQNYNYTPEQKAYRNPLMAGNILARLDHINTSQEYLIQMLDPNMLADAERYIADLAAKAESASANDETPESLQNTAEDTALYPEAAATAGAAVMESTVSEVPEVPEMLAGEEVSPAPWLEENAA